MTGRGATWHIHRVRTARAIALVVGLAACGSRDPSPSPRRETPTPTEPAAPTCEERASTTPARYRALARALCGELASSGIPGGSLAVFEDGVLAFEFAGGTRCHGQEGPMLPATPLRFGSATKLLTGRLALQLGAEGLVELDTPLTTTGLEPAPSLRSLADHGSGIVDPPASSLYRGDDRAFEDAIAGQARLEPGAHRYSNVGYALLARELARPGDETPEALLRRRVLEPGGLAGTAISPDRVRELEASCGHVRVDDAWVALSVPKDFEELAGNATWALPAGGAVGPPRDLALATLQRARLDGGPGTSTGRERERYVAGAFVATLSDGRTMVRHAGNTLDFATDTYAIADDGFALALMSNAGIHLRATASIGLRTLARLPAEDAILTVPAADSAQR